MSNLGIRTEALKNFQIFSGLSTRDLEHVAEVLKLQAIRKGTELIRQESQDGQIFFIVDGEVSVQMIGIDGKTSETLTTLSAGDTVGELALVRIGRRSASAVTAVDSVIYSADQNILNTLLDRHPSIGLCIFRNLSKILASRLMDTNTLVQKKSLSLALLRSI